MKRYPVFDLATFENIADIKHGSAKVRLFRLRKNGYIQQLHRDSYTVHHDPMIVASRMTWPSYMSLWFALNRHGLTNQLSYEIQVLTTRKVFRSEIELDNMRITFLRIKPKYFFGYDRIRFGDQEIFMATPEKAILDGLLFEKISASEIFDILRENILKLNVKRLVEFILRCENSKLAKRMGHMLGNLGHDVYRDLRKMITPSILLLDLGLPRRGVLDKRWMILDNVKRPQEVS